MCPGVLNPCVESFGRAMPWPCPLTCRVAAAPAVPRRRARVVTGHNPSVGSDGSCDGKYRTFRCAACEWNNSSLAPDWNVQPGDVSCHFNSTSTGAATCGRCRPGDAAPVGPARHDRPDRHQIRLRHRAVRRLHGVSRRPAAALVLAAGVGGRRGADHDHRRHRGHGSRSGADGLGRARRAAMRLLPIRPGDERGRAADARSRSRPTATSISR